MRRLPKSNLTPLRVTHVSVLNVDYFSAFRIEPITGTLRFIGEVELFPSFEIYVSTDGGPPAALIQWMT